MKSSIIQTPTVALDNTIVDNTNDNDRFKYSNLKNTLRLEHEIWSLKQELVSYKETHDNLKQSLNEQEQVRFNNDRTIDDLSEKIVELNVAKNKIELLEKELETKKIEYESR